MQSLSSELRSIIKRRLDEADTDDIVTIAIALCGRDHEEHRQSDAEGAPRFDVYVGSDTVLDNTTGLMWTRGHIGDGRMTQQDAEEACRNLEFGGYTDWRLPTRAELLTPVDDTRHDPAIDTDVFRCESAFYWTSTPAARSPSECAWNVLFSYGNANWLYRYYDGFVRAVRDGQ